MKSPRITPEEVGIIKRAQAGDESAFSALFHRYKGFVDNLLFQYIKDMDEAKDVTNIVFLKVHDKLSMFTAYESFGGWLRVLTNRTAIDYLREMKNKASVLGESDGRLPSETSSSSMEDDLINRMTYEQILAEFDKFPKTTCKVLKLFYANNMTVEQISEKLNVPTGTIKSMLSRTRRKVKKQLNLTS
jgi:RNA polymerase sigma-70 factor (ECF subfamily)